MPRSEEPAPQACSSATAKQFAKALPPLVAVICLSLAGQLYLAFVRQVNWDEFYFLSRVFQHQRGDLPVVLQTFHVHLFGWLSGVAGHEVDKVVAARLAMLMLEAGTFFLIYRTATRFVSPPSAAFAIVAYASCNYVIVHGAAFRFDPLATFLLMLALAAFTSRRLEWKRAAIGGAALAVAGLITIKSVFYLVPVGAAALWCAGETRQRLRILVAGSVVALVTFASLLLLHASQTASPDRAAVVRRASSSLDKVLDPSVIFEKWPYLAISVVGSFPTWAAVAIGLASVVAASFRRSGGADRRTAIVLLSLAFPLLTLVFYRNSFPYYYVFALAPAAVLAGVAVERSSLTGRGLSRIAALMGVFVALHVWGNFRVDQAPQRDALAAVHRMFPAPVAYIDRCSMVSTFPKTGFFMSTWGIEDYRKAGHPVIREAVAREKPRFVLANSPVLEAALRPGGIQILPGYELLPEDAAALRENYLHHWGPIWVLGKELADLKPGRGTRFEILAEGYYTLESESPVMIDGSTVPPGKVMLLASGIHEIEAVDAPGSAALRWGRHLPKPASAPPDDPIFRGF